jgi:xylan 1,4-beta-xylosidase
MKRRNLIKLSGLGATLAFFSHKLYQSDRWDNQNLIANNLNLPKSLASTQKSLSSKIEVDWNASVAESTPFVFGSNDYEITVLKKASDPTFQKLLADLNIPLIRIHHHNLCDRWTDLDSKSWDEAKIKAGYDVSYVHEPTIVQNIPRWPEWMATEGKNLLAISEHDNYATFCAELVNILNQRQQRQILYWEPLNELEKRYQEADKLDELWQIYNKAAKAMKDQDPSIKVGGPAMTWDNPQVLADFLEKCGANVDFISWHRYGTGNTEKSTDELMALTSIYKGQVHQFRSLASKYIPERKIPLFLSEYNINYSWQSGEERQNTHIGAVWFASVLKHLAEAGIEMATSWHLKDGIYGMIDPQNNLRPAATVFAWGNRYLTGTVVETDSDNSQVESLAVNQGQGKRSLLLINKSSTSAQVNLQTKPNTFSVPKIEAVSLGENGVSNLTETEVASVINSQQLTLEPYSLVLFKFSAT